MTNKNYSADVDLLVYLPNLFGRFLFSFGMMIYTDSIFLNWGPPKNPGPPSDMVEECEDD